MQLVAYLFSLILSSAIVSTTPIIKRDTAKVLSDLSTITRNTQYLSSELVFFINSTGNQTFAQHFTALQQHIDTATTAINAVGSFNSTDSEAIASQVGNFAQAGLNLLIALMKDEPTVTSVGKRSLILNDLNATNTETLNLFTALEDAIDENSFDSVSASQEQLGAAFTDAINDYS